MSSATSASHRKMKRRLIATMHGGYSPSSGSKSPVIVWIEETLRGVSPISARTWKSLQRFTRSRTQAPAKTDPDAVPPRQIAHSRINSAKMPPIISLAMLNEPFRILDNIPLIMCLASSETCQSRLPSPRNSNTKARPRLDSRHTTSCALYFLRWPDDAVSAPSHSFHTTATLPSAPPPPRPRPAPGRCVSLQGEGKEK